MSEVTINAIFDLDKVKQEISKAKDLKDNEQVFSRLSEIAKVKSEIEAALDAVISVEAAAKVEINSKAKALYGENWKAIAGDGYKITRRRTGTVYDIADPEKAEDYVKVEIKPDSGKIGDYIKAHSGLPEGIEYNPNRGEAVSIRVQ